MSKQEYHMAKNDLISALQLSKMLHIQYNTMKKWIVSGKVEPDFTTEKPTRYYFLKKTAQAVINLYKK